ncbi:hypothetical protein Nepgr_026991 [Nepenthes gracilis]|uniref:CBS domain-containing protein n=1 Tax=Nepenthes gracilis TaxID=150966 RepID=A0AAD3T9M2_NEPGR|nr:hypothetical protein Nepgr_026991 [Nepenthes gracilis]
MEAQLRREDDKREKEIASNIVVDRRATERRIEEAFQEREQMTSLSVKMSSPEAKLGMPVEDLWDIQQPQLTPTEKLNACFEDIQVSSFPEAAASLVEINSDSSLTEAVQILSQHKLLSTPMVDFSEPKDASWIGRYIGIVESAGIVSWVLQNVSYPCPNTKSSTYLIKFVQDNKGSFQWAPFLAIQKSNSMLTVLLLLSKYKMKSVLVVRPGEAKIDNIITQLAVIHMLAECVGLHWFENWGDKKLSDLGLPLMSPKHSIEAYEDEPVLHAFKMMRLKGIGGIPVAERQGRKAIGNVSIRDIQLLLIAPEIYRFLLGLILLVFDCIFTL